MSGLEEEIDDFINAKMTPERKREFEQMINGNSELQRQIETYREMKVIFEDATLDVLTPTTPHTQVLAYETFLKGEKGQDILKSIQNAESSYFKKKKASTTKQIWLYLGSAAAVLIIGVFGIMQWFGRPMDIDLYGKYKNNWKDIPSLTTKGETHGLAQAEEFFREGQYQKAGALFKINMPDKKEELYALVLIYRGVTDLELGMHQEAVKAFEQLRDMRSLDANKANWYLAMVYLKVNDTIKAKGALNKLTSDTKSFNYKKAKELLKQLN